MTEEGRLASRFSGTNMKWRQEEPQVLEWRYGISNYFDVIVGLWFRSSGSDTLGNRSYHKR